MKIKDLVLSFDEVMAIYEKKDTTEKKIWSDQVLMMNWWDNYRPPLGQERTFIHYAINLVGAPAFPLGDFKDMGCNWEENYKTLFNRYFKTFRNGNLIRMICKKFPVDYKEITGRDITVEEVVRILCLRTLISVRGVTFEHEIHETLVKKYANNSRFEYKAAPASMERLDVDGLMVCRATGEIVAKISIKTGAALSQQSIDRWRNVKGKTTPDIYVGYSDIESKELTWKYYTSKQVIKERMAA